MRDLLLASLLIVSSCATGPEPVGNTDPPTPTSTASGTATYRSHEPSPPDEAAKHEAGCTKGDAAACHQSALDHYYKPSPDNDVAALARFRKGCDLGYAPACNGVGTMYREGRGGIAKDDVEAVRWFRLACGKDSSTACDHLAQMFEYGKGGLPKDPTAAQAAKDRGKCLFEQSLQHDAGVAACPPMP